MNAATRPHIVVIDDDPSVCRAVRRLLKAVGMDAETFASGEDFLALLRAEPCFAMDCVVLDVQMPGLSGLDLQDRLHASGHAPPLIFVTAHDAAEARERALAGGAVAFLRKPFDDAQLIASLALALGRDGPAGACATSATSAGAATAAAAPAASRPSSGGSG